MIISSESDTEIFRSVQRVTMSQVVLIYPRKEYSKPLSRKDQRNAKKEAKNPAGQSLEDETQETMQVSSFLYASCTGLSDLEEALLRLRRVKIEVTCIEPVEGCKVRNNRSTGLRYISGLHDRPLPWL
jgi:hypothetical protein